MKRLIFGVLIYGERYVNRFFETCIRSLMDASNLSGILKGTDFLIFTDSESLDFIFKHPEFPLFQSYFNVRPIGFNRQLHAEQRYDYLNASWPFLASEAQKQGAYYAYTCPDLLYGKGFWHNIQQKLLEDDFDVVSVITPRITYETSKKFIDQFNGAPVADALYDIFRRNMHPVWLHAHWSQCLFTKIPTQLLWSDFDSTLARATWPYPLLVKPGSYLLAGERCSFGAKKPFHIERWSEFPCAELEYFDHFSPIYTFSPASVETVADFYRRGLTDLNELMLDQYTYYSLADKESPQQLISESEHVVNQINSLIRTEITG